LMPMYIGLLTAFALARLDDFSWCAPPPPPTLTSASTTDQLYCLCLPLCTVLVVLAQG
jgi:hypothetical protein